MTNAEARFSNSLRPRKPEGSLGRTAQDGHLDSHTAPELWHGGGRRGRLYTYRHTGTTRMTPALRWAAMRAILMFRTYDGESHKTVSTDHNFWRERKAEAGWNRGPSAYQPNALPQGQTGSRNTDTKNILKQESSWVRSCWVTKLKTRLCTVSVLTWGYQVVSELDRYASCLSPYSSSFSFPPPPPPFSLSLSLKI